MKASLQNIIYLQAITVLTYQTDVGGYPVRQFIFQLITLMDKT